MRFKSTLILLIVAAAAAAYFFLVEQPRYETEQRHEESETVLIRFNRDAVSRVVIRHPGRRPLEFDRRDGTWMITGPVRDRADDATVNTLITSIDNAEIERRLAPDPALLAGFGLDTTATRMSLMDQRGDTLIALAIGAHTLTKSHFYARRDADVLLLPAIIRRYALKEVTDFRDRRVVTFRLEDITKYTLASDSTSLFWERHPDLGWITVQNGDTITGDREKVEAIPQTLRGLRVRSFVTDNPYGFEHYRAAPHYTMTIRLADTAEPFVFECGRMDAGEFYARCTGSTRVVKLDGVFLSSFEKTVDDLRNKHLLSFSPGEVATITIAAPDTGGTIVHAGTGWSYPNPALGSIDDAAAGALLAALESLTFDSCVANRRPRPGGHGFNHPSYRIELLDAGGRPVDRMLAGDLDEKSGMRYVTSNSAGVLALIDEQALRDIESRFRELATR